MRHRHRRFGPGPYLTGLRKDPERWGAGFPYDVPAVDAVETLDLGAPVTLPAGDNGTGKSTLADAMGFTAAAAAAQFVIATHSPILFATPGARIYELDERGLAPCAYDHLDTVRLMRGFLDAPERCLRAALED